MEDAVVSRENSGDEISSAIELITRIGGSLQYSRGLSTALHDIIDIVADMTGANACVVYMMDAGAMRARSCKGIDISAIPAVITGAGVDGMVAETHKPAWTNDYCEPGAPARPDSGAFLPFRASISVPLLDGANLLGILNVLKYEPCQFTVRDRNFLLFVASQMAAAVKNTQLYEEVIRGFREMTTIHQVGQILSSVLDLDELIPTITSTCADHLSARGCVLRIFNTETGALEIRGICGAPDWFNAQHDARPGEGCAGNVYLSGNPVVSNKGEDWIVPGGGCPEDVMETVICAPIKTKNVISGTICVFGKEMPFSDDRAVFDESEAGLLAMIGSQVAMALENARLYAASKSLADEKESRIKELSLLLEITNIMRGSLDFEELLYIILTSVTMGEGLGFNRAALFLLEDNGRTLSGKMAVGPLEAETAEAQWHAIDSEGKPLIQIVREWGMYNMTAGFKIDKIVKKAKIPMLAEKGILARTVIERSSFNVTDYIPVEGSEEAVLSEIGFSTFVTAPLIAQDRAVGLIIVDNMVTKTTITEDDAQFLQLFANQAATTIEISNMYKNLENMNRRLIDARDLMVRTRTLATLGEFSAGVAHELRNPLVSIGGFARRLTKMLEEGSKEARYALIISREVEGMEKILGQILEFVGGAKPEFRSVDVVNMLENVFMLFTDAINDARVRVVTEYDEGVRNILVDEVQMRQLFINLIKNAIEAMREKGGTLKVSASLIGPPDGGIGFEITDTGVGIPEDDLSHIFDPFFTKKETGTGLGLPICSKIVETNHGGRIFVDSKLGRGTSIYVWLPPDTVPES